MQIHHPQRLRPTWRHRPLICRNAFSTQFHPYQRSRHWKYLRRRLFGPLKNSNHCRLLHPQYPLSTHMRRYSRAPNSSPTYRTVTHEGILALYRGPHRLSIDAIRGSLSKHRREQPSGQPAGLAHRPVIAPLLPPESCLAATRGAARDLYPPANLQLSGPTTGAWTRSKASRLTFHTARTRDPGRESSRRLGSQKGFPAGLREARP